MVSRFERGRILSFLPQMRSVGLVSSVNLLWSVKSAELVLLKISRIAGRFMFRNVNGERRGAYHAGRAKSLRVKATACHRSRSVMDSRNDFQDSAE